MEDQVSYRGRLRQQNRTMFALVCVCVSFIVACADEADLDEGDLRNPEVSAGIPAGRVLDDVSEGEAERLCTAFMEAARATISAVEFCTFFAVDQNTEISEDGKEVSIDRVGCRESRDGCVSADLWARLNSDCSGTGTARYAECPHTVGEWETCATAWLKHAKSILRSISCSVAPTPSQIEAVDYRRPPPECAALFEQCPLVTALIVSAE